MAGQTRSIVIGRHATFLELKARMYGQQGGRISLFKTAVDGSKTRLHSCQHIGNHTEDQDMLFAIEKVEGGGKRQRAAKAKQHDETAPLSRVGGAGWVASSFGIAYSGL